MWETWVRSLGWEDSLEERMATHSSILARKIPWSGVTKSQTRPKGLSMHVQRSWIFGIIFKPREHGHSTVNEQELGSNSIPPTSCMAPIKLLTLYEPYFPLICNRRFWPHTNLKELFRGVKEIMHVHCLAYSATLRKLLLLLFFSSHLLVYTLSLKTIKQKDGGRKKPKAEGTWIKERNGRTSLVV